MPVIYLLLILILIPTAGFLTSTVAAAGKLIIGVEDTHYLPHYSVENGVYTGFARELLDAFFEARGYSFEYRALPVARLFHGFVNNQIDFKYPDNVLWQSEMKQDKNVVYSDPVVAHIDGVSVLPENKGHGAEKMKILGTVRGFTPLPWLRRIDSGELIVLENDSFQGVVEQTIIGRVDGAYANVDVVQYLLKHVLGTPGALEFDASLPYSRSQYHMSTIKHPAVIAEFNMWMQENSDFISELKKKYGLDDESE